MDLFHWHDTGDDSNSVRKSSNASANAHTKHVNGGKWDLSDFNCSLLWTHNSLVSRVYIE